MQRRRRHELRDAGDGATVARDLVLLRGRDSRAQNEAGETIRTLDGIQRTLTGEMLVIADRDGAVGIAASWAVIDEINPATRTIMLEAANFNAASVRRTSRTLGLPTEASLRFEKGLDPHLPAKALARAAQLIAEIAGGKPAAEITDVYKDLPAERVIHVRPERVNAVLGTDLPDDEMKRLLSALHFTVERVEANRLKVTVPTYRSDIERGRPDRGDRATVRLRPHRTDAARSSAVRVSRKGRWSKSTLAARLSAAGSTR